MQLLHSTNHVLRSELYTEKIVILSILNLPCTVLMNLRGEATDLIVTATLDTHVKMPLAFRRKQGWIYIVERSILRSGSSSPTSITEHKDIFSDRISVSAMYFRCDQIRCALGFCGWSCLL